MRQVVLVALAVAFTAAMLLLAPGLVMGSAGSQGTLLVISSSTTTQLGLYRVSLLDVASGTKHIVLQGKTLCCNGAWSSDGKLIALTRGNDVVLLGGDGRKPRRLPLLRAPPGSTAHASPSFGWAPNSRSLAINEADGHRLAIRGIDGRVRVIRRTGSMPVMEFVTWSPDGRWISYTRANYGGANGAGCCSSSLHLIHPDGSGDHTVAVMHEAVHDTPSPALWAPDGHRFAFSTEGRDVRDPTLALVDADSGKITTPQCQIPTR
jgi:Tol biopolymer transport system component